MGVVLGASHQASCRSAYPARSMVMTSSGQPCWRRRRSMVASADKSVLLRPMTVACPGPMPVAWPERTDEVGAVHDVHELAQVGREAQVQPVGQGQRQLLEVDDGDLLAVVDGHDPLFFQADEDIEGARMELVQPRKRAV